MKHITVIIPYYQVEQGILSRSLQSLVRQYLPDGYHANFIIIDDGSPISAESELDGLTYGDQFSFRIIKKENGGAASARNAALKSLDKDTDYIAFLDSDDIWSPTHLHQGIHVLELGHDFYFTDNQRTGFHESYFTNFCPEIFTLLKFPEIADSAYGISPSDALELIVKPELLGNLIFSEGIKFAGEDVLFFSTMASKSKTLCLSKKINIILDHIKLRDLLFKNIDFVQKTKDYLNWITAGYRNDFIFFSMRSMVKSRKIDKTLVSTAAEIGISSLKHHLLMIKILLARTFKIYTPVI